MFDSEASLYFKAFAFFARKTNWFLTHISIFIGANTKIQMFSLSTCAICVHCIWYSTQIILHLVVIDFYVISERMLRVVNETLSLTTTIVSKWDDTNNFQFYHTIFCLLFRSQCVRPAVSWFCSVFTENCNRNTNWYSINTWDWGKKQICATKKRATKAKRKPIK